MGLMLPEDLAYLLNSLGFRWPLGDEEQLFALGQDWINFASVITEHTQAADLPVQEVVTVNQGAPIDAFANYYSGPDGPAQAAGGNSTAAVTLGAGYIVVAVVVLVLKIVVIIQLVILAIQIAVAIATAIPTGGASLAKIPIFRMLTSLAINLAIDMAIRAILGE